MTVSVPCLFLTVSFVGLQYVIVVFSGLLILRIALSVAAYPMLYLTYCEQNRKMDHLELRLQIYFMLKIVDATTMCMLLHEHHRSSHLWLLMFSHAMNSLITSKDRR